MVGYPTDMDLSYSPEDEAFRAEVRAWLEENLSGEFAELRGKGGPGREHEAYDERVAWDRHLAKHGWTCIGWPQEYGGRPATPRGQDQPFSTLWIVPTATLRQRAR